MGVGFRPYFVAACLLGPLHGCQAPAEQAAPAQAPEDQRRAAAPEAGVAPAADPLAAARAAAAQEDWNRALFLLDQLRAGQAHSTDYWSFYGDATLRFAEQRRAEGRGDPGLMDGLYADAGAAYGRALELEPDLAAARQGLIGALLARGDAAAAWDQAQVLLDQLGTDGENAPAYLQAGRAALQLTAQSVQSQQPVPGAVRRGEQALLRALALGDEGAVVPLSDLYAWQGLGADARRVLVAGLQRQPAEQGLYDRLWNLGASNLEHYVTDLELVRQAAPAHPQVLWYLGEGRRLQHEQARQAGDFLLAYEALDRAQECYLAAQSLEPSFGEACGQRLHELRCARAWCLWQEPGRIHDAANTFLEALEADPSRLEAEPVPGSLRLGIDAVVGHYFGANDLPAARRFLAQVVALHDQNPDWTNNLGFFSRDLGVIEQQRGNAERAAELFEEAWRAYSRSVELAPDDVRLINDRALIAVYYLDQHHELAEAELHRAIALGQAQLQEAGADGVEHLQDLDEAVGDAWENLAYLDVMRRRRTDRAPRYLEESVGHFPFAERAGVQRLRRELERLAAEQQPD